MIGKYSMGPGIAASDSPIERLAKMMYTTVASYADQNYLSKLT